MGYDRKVLLVKVGSWKASSNPGTGNLASASISAAGSDVKNVCTSLSFGIATNTSAPTASILTVVLRDGPSGTGNVIQSWPVSVPASVGYNFNVSLSDLWIEGSANSDMVLEFSGALANCLEYVNMAGCTTI